MTNEKRKKTQTQWLEDTEAWIKRIPDELDSLPSIPEKGWKVFEANTLNAAQNAARNDAWDAALNAARNDAWDAARNDAWNAAQNAAQNAARNDAWDAALNAARNDAWNAAQNAVRNDAWNAALNAARNAALDARLFATIRICAGLNLDKKHIQYVEERWEANKRGYRVYCDVSGVLYVYRKK